MGARHPTFAVLSIGSWVLSFKGSIRSFAPAFFGWALFCSQCCAQSDTVNLRATSAFEAAKILAQLDFLEKDCKLKVTVGNKEALIGTVIRGSETSTVEHYRREARKMATSYGQKTACEGLAKTYGWKPE